MDINELLRDQIFGIIENQIEANDPPETSETLARLRKEGYDEFTAKQLIGQCVTVELFDVMQNGNAFDEERYTQNLKNLPKEP
jgi:hypothetical protein